MIRIISFGYGHGNPPEAQITIDIRKALRNPFHDESLKELNAFSPKVYRHVQRTKGAYDLVTKLHDLAMNWPSQSLIVAIGCVGGRHRSAALAMWLEDLLATNGVFTEIEHRDIDKPLLPAGLHRR
jgi:UPF0042 nucleotide-binding protein